MKKTISDGYTFTTDIENYDHSSMNYQYEATAVLYLIHRTSLKIVLVDYLKTKACDLVNFRSSKYPPQTQTWTLRLLSLAVACCRFAYQYNKHHSLAVKHTLALQPRRPRLWRSFSLPTTNSYTTDTRAQGANGGRDAGFAKAFGNTWGSIAEFYTDLNSWLATATDPTVLEPTDAEISALFSNTEIGSDLCATSNDGTCQATCLHASDSTDCGKESKPTIFPVTPRAAYLGGSV